MKNIMEKLCRNLSMFRFENSIFPVDTGRRLNVHKTFRMRPGRSIMYKKRIMYVHFTSCVYWVYHFIYQVLLKNRDIASYT